MTTRRPVLSMGLILTVLAPTIALTLHDLVFQLPDNQHEASLGFFVTVFGLLFAWALGGYFVGRGARSVFMAIGAGAVTAAISVGILWLTFVTLNRLFTDRMSYEPDRIRAFRASGYRTMREYLDHGMGSGQFPLLMGVAALAGMAGSVLGEKIGDRESLRAWRALR
jgi:hypothetical protein